MIEILNKQLKEVLSMDFKTFFNPDNPILKSIRIGKSPAEQHRLIYELAQGEIYQSATYAIRLKSPIQYKFDWEKRSK